MSRRNRNKRNQSYNASNQSNTQHTIEKNTSFRRQNPTKAKAQKETDHLLNLISQDFFQENTKDLEEETAKSNTPAKPVETDFENSSSKDHHPEDKEILNEETHGYSDIGHNDVHERTEEIVNTSESVNIVHREVCENAGVVDSKPEESIDVPFFEDVLTNRTQKPITGENNSIINESQKETLVPNPIFEEKAFPQNVESFFVDESRLYQYFQTKFSGMNTFHTLDRETIILHTDKYFRISDGNKAKLIDKIIYVGIGGNAR